MPFVEFTNVTEDQLEKLRLLPLVSSIVVCSGSDMYDVTFKVTQADLEALRQLNDRLKDRLGTMQDILPHYDPDYFVFPLYNDQWDDFVNTMSRIIDLRNHFNQT